MMWIVLLAGVANAQEVSGFAEVRGSMVLGADGTPVQLVERVRSSFEAPLGERLSLSTTIEAGLSQGRNSTTVLRGTLEDSALNPLLLAAGCSWPEYDNGLFRTNDAGDYLIVDRLYLDWYHPIFDLRVGRQALQWGSAQFINPTDPFPQVLFTQPWLPRAGVNSARITIPFGELNQFQGVVGTDDDFKTVRLATRTTVNWKQTDWSLIAAYRQESDELLAGVDIKGTLGVGYWFEGALRIRDLTDDVSVTEQFVVGVDYSVPVFEALVFSAQYVRNGDTGDSGVLAGLAGGPECEDESLFGAPAEPDPFAPFLTGHNYGMVTVSSAFTPSFSASTTWLQNLGDGSAIWIPSVNLLLPKQFDLSLSGQIPVATWGNGEFKPDDDDLILRLPSGESADLSGLVPDASLFLWTRLNF